MSSVITPPDTAHQRTIPVECYMALERLIQTLRLHILSRASRQNRITQDGIREALCHLVTAPPSRGELYPAKGSPESAVPSQDDFLFLERRFHKLRTLVMNLATQDSQYAVEPGDIHRAWQEVFQYPVLLKDVLGDPDPTSAAERSIHTVAS